MRILRLALVAALAAATAVSSQEVDWEKVQITTVPVAPGVAMLSGRGGNIGVSVGDDGVILIDDQYAPLTPKIQAAVAALSPKPLRFLLNTHWHPDHTGGNENLGKAGVTIVAHDNVRRRLGSEQYIELFDRRFPPSPAAALPVVTFSDAVTFHFNGDEIHAFHVAPAHTDGDAVVHFRRADVVHTGDLFFSGGYPVIDVSSGGSLDGMIAAADRLLALAGEKTRIIPGHGPLAGRADLRAYRDMLVAVRAAVLPLVEAGKSLDEVKAAKPTVAFDEQWGKGFVSPEVITTTAYLSLKSKG
jgi:glyoxylase-like metal-dependent hydrolase (beta-lactamase superfamily II)